MSQCNCRCLLYDPSTITADMHTAECAVHEGVTLYLRGDAAKEYREDVPAPATGYVHERDADFEEKVTKASFDRVLAKANTPMEQQALQKELSKPPRAGNVIEVILGSCPDDQLINRTACFDMKTWNEARWYWQTKAPVKEKTEFPEVPTDFNGKPFRPDGVLSHKEWEASHRAALSCHRRRSMDKFSGSQCIICGLSLADPACTGFKGREIEKKRQRTKAKEDKLMMAYGGGGKRGAFERVMRQAPDEHAKQCLKEQLAKKLPYSGNPVQIEFEGWGSRPIGKKDFELAASYFKEQSYTAIRDEFPEECQRNLNLTMAWGPKDDKLVSVCGNVSVRASGIKRTVDIHMYNAACLHFLDVVVPGRSGEYEHDWIGDDTDETSCSICGVKVSNTLLYDMGDHEYGWMDKVIPCEARHEDDCACCGLPNSDPECVCIATGTFGDEPGSKAECQMHGDKCTCVEHGCPPGQSADCPEHGVAPTSSADDVEWSAHYEAVSTPADVQAHMEAAAEHIKALREMSNGPNQLQLVHLLYPNAVALRTECDFGSGTSDITIELQNVVGDTRTILERIAAGLKKKWSPHAQHPMRDEPCRLSISPETPMVSYQPPSVNPFEKGGLV